MYLTKRLVRHKTGDGDEIWLNTLSGAVDRLSRREADAILHATECEPREYERLMDRLQARGYLYETQQDEDASFTQLVQSYRQADRGAVTNLVICPTYSCNLRCTYCFEHRAHPDLPRQVMETSSVDKVFGAFSQIREMEPSRRYALGLFGGEPLMASTHALVLRILAHAHADSLQVMIVTNGVNVTGFLPLLQRYSAGIKSLQLTLDGPEEVHNQRRPAPRGKGTFGAVAAAVNDLLEANIHVMLRVNIDPSNVRHLPQLARIIKSRGWTQSPGFACGLSPVKDHLTTGDIPNAVPDAELLSALFDVYDQDPESEQLFGLDGIQVLQPLTGMLGHDRFDGPKVYNCEANYGGFWVAGPDGLLFPCPEAIGQQDLAIGRFEPRFEIWEEKRSQWVNRDIGSLDPCRDCSVAPLCGGGCAYASIARENNAGSVRCDSELASSLHVYLERRLPDFTSAN